MYVRMGLMNGQIVESDHVDEKVMQDEIDAAGGRIGSKDFKNVVCENVDDAMALMVRILNMALNDLETGEISLRIDGRDITFKSREVGWYRIIR